MKALEFVNRFVSSVITGAVAVMMSITMIDNYQSTEPRILLLLGLIIFSMLMSSYYASACIWEDK